MKKTYSALIIAIATFAMTPIYAGNEAGDDSARHYRVNADEYTGKKIDIDCVCLIPARGGPNIEGVSFFQAMTVDDDNHARGGRIIVALLDEDVKTATRKYGTTPERNNKGRPETKRLRGTLHVLDEGRTYIDESGDAHALITAYIAADGKMDFGPADKPGFGKKKGGL